MPPAQQLMLDLSDIIYSARHSSAIHNSSESNILVLSGIAESEKTNELKGSRLKFVGVLEAQQELAKRDAAIAARIEKTRRETQAAIMGIMEPKLDQIGHPKPKEALYFIYDVLRTMLNQRLRRTANGEKGPGFRQSEEAFILELRQMADAYLQTRM